MSVHLWIIRQHLRGEGELVLQVCEMHKVFTASCDKILSLEKVQVHSRLVVWNFMGTHNHTSWLEVLIAPQVLIRALNTHLLLCAAAAAQQ